MGSALSSREYFEDQYVLRKTLPTFMDHVAEWEALSTDDQFAGHGFSVENYGTHSRQNFEIFKVKDEEKPKGLAIFIHGGFWRAMHRRQSRFVAKPYLDSGYDCVIAEYRLMPEFRLADLVADTADMFLKLSELRSKYKLSGNVLLSGHSAGAHLAAFGLKQASSRGFTADKISLLLFSGVFDIYPVSITSLGDELKMSPEEIARWSVYEGDADNGITPLFLVGASETDDFKRQTIVGAQHLGPADAQNIHIIPDTNHLTLMTKFSTDLDFSRRIITQLEKAKTDN